MMTLPEELLARGRIFHGLNCCNVSQTGNDAFLRDLEVYTAECYAAGWRAGAEKMRVEIMAALDGDDDAMIVCVPVPEPTEIVQP